MKATILETAMEIADHLLSDIDNKISTNVYGEWISEYRAFLETEGGDCISVQLTQETDGLEQTDYFYTLHLVDNVKPVSPLCVAQRQTLNAMQTVQINGTDSYYHPKTRTAVKQPYLKLPLIVFPIKPCVGRVLFHLLTVGGYPSVVQAIFH